MDNRGKRKLLRAICDALTLITVDLSEVHFTSFHRRDDSTPHRDRYVIVGLYEIQRRVKRASPGTLALWEGTGRYRVQVYDNRCLSRVASFEQSRRQNAFPINRIAATIATYAAEVRAWEEAEERKRVAEAGFTTGLQQLTRDFRLNEFTETEYMGWRKSIAPVEAEAYPDGLTLSFNGRLTVEEIRTLLRCARELGLLPGGIRQKDRVPDADLKNRYERV